MERFYDPLHGGVFLDGQPINEMNVQEYRKNIALVSQEPVRVTFLFIPSRSGVLIIDRVRRHFTLVLFASTSCLVPRSQGKRSHRKSSSRLAEMQTSCHSSRACLSTCITPFYIFVSVADFLFHSGFDTDVGGKGSQLSGGQKRKFAHLIVRQGSCTDG